MNQELITFPWAGGEWRDSYEGGLFVLMVVPEKDENDYDTNCHVDCWPRIKVRLNSPDVVFQRRDVFWPKDTWVNKEYLIAGEIFRHFMDDPDPRKKEWARWAVQAAGPGEWSVPLWASIHLGSTSQALWSDRQGAYWQARPTDLTPAGLALYEGLQAAYNTEPILLTFLDT